ncbi:MAG: redoxin domain-containing protein [Sphingomonadales bacterium]
MQNFPQAPELNVSTWLNSDNPITLESLRGKVVLIECFQMLCPGCVSHGLPQAHRVHQVFNREQVMVLGLHTVFEHHDAQGTEAALKAFLHEYRIPFPVGIDMPGTNGPTPQTMTTYRLRGTPSILLIDRQGRLRKNHFGQVDDMVLGAEVMALVGEAAIMPNVEDKTAGVCPAP